MIVSNMAELLSIPEALQRIVVSDVKIGKEIDRGSFGLVLEATLLSVSASMSCDI